MADQEQTTAISEDKQNQDAAAIILQHEEARLKRKKRKARRKRRRAEKEHQRMIAQMEHSLSVIKKCVIAISTVMVVSLLTGIFVLIQVRNQVEHVKTEAEKIKAQVEIQAEKIKGEVEDIQREAEIIRDKIRHPLETLGGFMGRKLESNVSDLLGQDE